MSYKAVGTQLQNKKGPSKVAASWEKNQSTSTKHKQPRHSVGKGK